MRHRFDVCLSLAALFSIYFVSCSMQSAYEPRPRSQLNTSICSNYANQLIKSLQELKESKDYQTVLDVFTKVNEGKLLMYWY